MKLTEKKAIFKGEYNDLLMFQNSGIKYASTKKIINMNLHVTWICENSDEDIHDLIDARQMELFNIGIFYINN